MSATSFGDYNGDGVVDAADYTAWRDALGSGTPNGTGADGSGNGTVDQADYDVWVMHFGEMLPLPGGGAISSAPVPEPDAAALLVLGAILIAGYSRRKLTKGLLTCV